ncbi:hypothetical protein quinque_000840 [Culex quinquefasciatus]
MAVDEPDSARIAEILTPKSPAKAAAVQPMVSIPVASVPTVVKEEFREIDSDDRALVRYPMCVSHEAVPNVLSFNEDSTLVSGRMTPCQFNEIELALLQRAMANGQDEVSLLTQSLSLSMMEAQFLRMHLKEFNLKARSVLELFKYCEGTNDRFCRCPEIRKRVYEMGILVQRSVP